MSENARTSAEDVDLGRRVPPIRLPRDEERMALALRPLLQAAARQEAALRAGAGGQFEIVLPPWPNEPARRRLVVHVPKGQADHLVVDEIVRHTNGS